MKIIVVGCGKIGLATLSSLVGEGHNVVAIDNNAAVIEDIQNLYDVMCVNGNGTDCDTLKEAGVEDCELFAAMTGSDELNMLSCFLARSLGAKHTVARIRNPEYNDSTLGFLKQQLSLSVAVNPELYAAQELYNLLKFPSAVNIETFSRSHFEMVEIVLKPDSPLDGMKLYEMRKKYPAKFLVCAVGRGEEVFIPGGGFELRGGDHIGITAEPSEISKLLKMLGILQKQARNVMLLGASRIAYYLAKLLVGGGNNVKIIEQDRARCEEFADLLPEVNVICGDGSQPELLLEEGLRQMDAFVSLTGIDEENILIAFFAGSQGVPKVISKVNRPELAQLAEKLGLDCVISPRKHISDVLTRYARALQNSCGSKVETLYKLMGGKAEAIEFNVSEDFAYLGVPLREMKLKPGTLIAGIIRGRKSVIPTGDDMILAEDKVVVLSGDVGLRDLMDIMDNGGQA